MANNQGLDIDLDVFVPGDAPPGVAAAAGGAGARGGGGNQGRQNLQNNNQFGLVRDRLFHAMLVRVALSYNNNVKLFWRRVIEFLSLVTALCLLATLLFVHLMFSRSATSCLDHIKETWPREGVLRVEVIRNLRTVEYKEQLLREWHEQRRTAPVCNFNPANVLLYGPAVIPAEIRALGYARAKSSAVTQKKIAEPKRHDSDGLLSFFLRPFPDSLQPVEEDAMDEDVETTEFFAASENEDEELSMFEEEFSQSIDASQKPVYEYVAEYSLLYGVLRLPAEYRARHKIPQMTVRIDSEAACFGDPPTRRVMHLVVGYEDSVMASLRSLAKDEKDIGYLHDLRTNEHYHFVSLMMGKTGYITAAFVMVVFTFAISMLLRFSHHQIFLFIVDLLHMFELNQPLVFPAAPLLTVILALVGMEAIMSEVFADTTTAFYVILVVWIADQFDAICCHSPISKRFWLRFFYLYQFFFYAYQYRFGGQYGGIALLTSAAFILHSMIFFFHHYEMPLILYHDRLQRILSDVQHNPRPGHVPNNAGVNLPPGSILFHVHQLRMIRRTQLRRVAEQAAELHRAEDAAVQGLLRMADHVEEVPAVPEGRDPVAGLRRLEREVEEHERDDGDGLEEEVRDTDE